MQRLASVSASYRSYLEGVVREAVLRIERGDIPEWGLDRRARGEVQLWLVDLSPALSDENETLLPFELDDLKAEILSTIKD